MRPLIDAPSLGPVRILLVTAQVDRHARELIQAFGNLGAQVNTTGLAEIGFDTGSASGLAIPHFGGSLPDAVCVRTMDAGSFEQVTRRLGVLHALTRLGVLVSNDARAIENCVDKSMTSFLIARAGLPSPRSFTVESRAEALRITAAEAGPLVLKPLFGAQGNGLKLIHTADDLPAAEDIAGGVYYLQRFAGVETAGRWSDVRILVSAGRAAASMRRQAASWITNVKQGAEPLPMPPDGDLEALAVAATEAVGGDFCGVDLLRDAAGRAQIIEVNSMPAWTGLKKATGCDLAAIRARDLLAQVEARRAASAFRSLSAAE
ncbi:RimK family alpha-L-glutamate ligase [Aurantimonas sp. A3-2-R12]|uniref:RimK family alpha-L-glutamate ligase n=1 Tax=Aurantimonas sp. A3-2-R12 TaxID=3114362 RepID=UPI002E17CC61|nr:RimK family alpha-L-glutamate ligase [Aurantimonas sp. A3-2-R12]